MPSVHRPSVHRPSIRRAAATDAAIVATLVARLLTTLRKEPVDAAPLEAPTARWLAKPDSFVAFLAEEDGQPVGVLCLATSVSVYARGAFGVISELYVEPDGRSAGVGALLLDRARAHGREKGWDRIEVGAPNAVTWARTVAFYERNGFTEIGPRLVTTL